MNVVRDIRREIVVNNVEYVGGVKTARHEVGARQKFEFPRQKIGKYVTTNTPVNLELFPMM